MARRNDGWGDGDKIKIGVCVMEKKVSGWTLGKLMIFLMKRETNDLILVFLLANLIDFPCGNLVGVVFSHGTDS